MQKQKKMSPKTAVVTGEKAFIVNETEISVVLIPVQEQKEKATSMSRKHKRELNISNLV